MDKGPQFPEGSYAQAHNAMRNISDESFDDTEFHERADRSFANNARGVAGFLDPSYYAKHVKQNEAGENMAAQEGEQDYSWLAQFHQPAPTSRKNPFGDQYQSAPYRMGKHSKPYNRAKDQ